MYLPRSLISHLYTQLVRTHHPLSPHVLIFVALEPDALCACRILTLMLKRDYIPHKIQPIAGYGELMRAGETLLKPMRLSEGGSGGVVVCLGVAGLVDLETIFRLEVDENGVGGFDGVDIWIFDERRPWSLANVFGGTSQLTNDALEQQEHNIKQSGVDRGQITRHYQSGQGGIIVFDDGDIEGDLTVERDAWFALAEMPEVDDDGDSIAGSESGSENEQTDSQTSPSRKRKSWSDQNDEDSDSEKENRPRQRRRSNSSSPIPSSIASPSKKRTGAESLQRTTVLDSTPPSNQQSSPPTQPQEPSARTLRRRLLRMRRKHVATIESYNSYGTSYSEPISSLMYSLASELGREDNDLLWLAIVGVSSTELYGRTQTGVSLLNHDLPTSFTGWSSSRGARIRQILRDEVRRLNPPELNDANREVNHGYATDVIPTHARSPTDTSIRLSPEPRFLLIRHWSLYDSMLHSPYLAAKLHIWTDAGKRRLHKLLAKMGVSLTQCKQSYTHMDMDLKKVLREKLLHFAPMYGLDGLVPPPPSGGNRGSDSKDGWGFVRSWGWKACLSAADVAVIVGAILEVGPHQLSLAASSRVHKSAPQSSPVSGDGENDEETNAEESTIPRFYAAYDSLLSPTSLLTAIPQAQHLHRAILRTGTSLLQKRQIRHLRAFRMAIVKEGPDVALFSHPGALTKLALWVGEAIGEVEGGNSKNGTKKYGGTPLVLGCVDEAKDVYIVVGVGGGGAGKDPEVEQEKKKRREDREKRRNERQEKKEAKRRERDERMAANGLEDDEVETEDEDSESESDSSSDEEDEAAMDAEAKRKRMTKGRNRFGNAFQEVIEETSARVRLDSFEHCVVEVRKEDLSGFLESLSMKAVVS